MCASEMFPSLKMLFIRLAVYQGSPGGVMVSKLD